MSILQIEINENRHRYYLTREVTQREMSDNYGVTVETIGKYYPNRALASPSCPPLAILLKGPEEAIKAASEFVHQILRDGPPIVATSVGKSCEEFTKKMYVGFVPEAGRLSAVRARLLGPPPAASHLRHIMRVAGEGTMVSLRGQGSGHVQLGMSMEQLADPLHLYIQAGNQDELSRAVCLAEDLILVVKHLYDHKQI